MDNDILICFGGEVKALEDGRVEGYLVRFSSQRDPDISQTKDFFTLGTDFDLDRSTKSTIYFDHGLDDTIKRRKLGQGEMKIDDVGVWISGVLNRRDRYENAIYEMARAGKLGWSSGTAIHLTEREKVGDAHKILRWPLGLDASLTPTPAEPRNDAIASLKSYSENRIAVKFMDIDGDIKNAEEPPADPETKAVAEAEAVAEAKVDAPADKEMPADAVEQKADVDTGEVVKADKTIKGIFEATLEEFMDEQQTPWMLVTAFDRAFYRICEAASAMDILPSTIDFNGLIDEAVNELAVRLREWGRDELQKMRDGRMVMAPSYLSLRSPLKDLVEMKSRPHGGVTSEYHSQTVLAAVEEFATEALTLVPVLKAWTERRKSIAELRANKSGAEGVKVGRVISAATAARMGKLRKKLTSAMSEMQAMGAELDELMSLAKSPEGDTTATASMDQHPHGASMRKSAEPAETSEPEIEAKSADTLDDTLQLAAAMELEFLKFNSIGAVGVR